MEVRAVPTTVRRDFGSAIAGSRQVETRQTERCPYCGALDIIKKGVRKNKYGAVQLFYCAHCAKKFLCEQQELIGPELGDATYPQPIVAQIPEADLLAELQA